MSRPLYIESFSALLPDGIYSMRGVIPWESGQKGAQDVTRRQVLDKPYVNFGKLSLSDRLVFGASSLILSRYPLQSKETAAITLGIRAGSLSTDLRYMESVMAGFPSPAVFSATLPSSAIADVAIYFELKGPNRVCAGDAASGLTALELACLLLDNGKASAALVLSVNAIEPEDFESPLLDQTIERQNRAFAFLLNTVHQNGGLGFRLNASFSHSDKEVRGGAGELYFTELTRLLVQKINGGVSAALGGIEAGISIHKEF
ncbi:MAG TPA: beta-ketoacyl synthase N-terminal-like domain-containing protein [Chitinivibrionales bacterium]|nr:beta-ketoacyl synthase N-terminal-like domain-containing protein [Chitinivibrionales bacterium]